MLTDNHGTMKKVLYQMASQPKPDVDIDLVLIAIEDINKLSSEDKKRLDSIFESNPKIFNDYKHALQLKGSS